MAFSTVLCLVLPCIFAAINGINSEVPMLKHLLEAIRQESRKSDDILRAHSVGQTETVDRRNVCGGVINSRAGVITSPNFPNSYSDNVICDWTVKVPDGMQIIVAFTDFQLEAHQTCNYDSVQIYNGPELTSPLVGKFCGENIPATFGSVSNSVRIVFSTDHSVTKRGFQMTFIAINQEEVCGITVCPENWIQHNRSCYLFVQNQMSFDAAEENCQQYGAHLVHVNSAEENQFLKSELLPKSQEDTAWWQCWMGFSDRVTDGDWKWLDTNTGPEFTDWAPGKPDNWFWPDGEDCAAFDFSPFVKDGKWNDKGCTQTTGSSVCEK